MKLDKKWFYLHLKNFDNGNKHIPIFLDIPLNENDTRYRLIFDWNPRKTNGDFNPIMYAQLIDTTKSVGQGKYIIPDLIFNCVKENITTDYKLYKHLDSWVENAFRECEE